MYKPAHRGASFLNRKLKLKKHMLPGEIQYFSEIKTILRTNLVWTFGSAKVNLFKTFTQHAVKREERQIVVLFLVKIIHW